MTTPPPTPPGWYPDPSGVGGRRYWDGTRWTEYPPDRPAGPSRHQGPDKTGRASKRRLLIPAVIVASVLAYCAVLLVGFLIRDRNPSSTPEGTCEIPGSPGHIVTATISVHDMPFGVAVDPGTHTVYVANYRAKVSVIDGATHTVTASVPGSRRLWAVRGGRRIRALHTVYVANHEDGTVSVIDGATNTVSATVPVGKSALRGGGRSGTDTGLRRQSLQLHRVGHRRTATNTVSATVPVGSHPDGVRVHPAGPGPSTSPITKTARCRSSTERRHHVSATVPVGKSPDG